MDRPIAFETARAGPAYRESATRRLSGRSTPRRCTLLLADAHGDRPSSIGLSAETSTRPWTRLRCELVTVKETDGPEQSATRRPPRPTLTLIGMHGFDRQLDPLPAAGQPHRLRQRYEPLDVDHLPLVLPDYRHQLGCTRFRGHQRLRDRQRHRPDHGGNLRLIACRTSDVNHGMALNHRDALDPDVINTVFQCSSPAPTGRAHIVGQTTLFSSTFRAGRQSGLGHIAMPGVPGIASRGRSRSPCGSPRSRCWLRRRRPLIRHDVAPNSTRAGWPPG